MSLTTTQIRIIQTAVPVIAANADAVAEAFYAQLFAIDPSLRPMFRGDMKEQGRKLMQMLSVALSNLESLDTLRPALRALGERHVNYGVTEHHYQTVGLALLNTLEMVLGDAFTSEAHDAWASLYTALTAAVTHDLYPTTEAAAD